MKHINVSEQVSIGSDNVSSWDWHQAITLKNNDLLCWCKTTKHLEMLCHLAITWHQIPDYSDAGSRRDAEMGEGVW